MCTNAFPNYTVTYQLCIYFKSIPWSGPPTWKIQYYLFNIVNEEMGPDPIPLENLNFKIKILKVCLGPLTRQVQLSFGPTTP